MNDTIKLSDEKPLMIAHRGVSGLERENTCAAFVAAGNRSYFGIETDLYFTADGNFVCLHDASTQRVGIDDVKPEFCTLATIQSVQLCDLDGKRSRSDLRVPTLGEYIGICKKYKKVAVLELKSTFSEEQIQEICRRIQEAEWLNKTVFIAFDLENLKKIRKFYPKQQVQYLTSKATEDLSKILNEHNMDLDINHKALTKELVNELHKNGHKVNVWTVNTPEDAETCIRLGVDFITTNILE